MGGNAGDEDYAGRWRQFTRDKFYKEGVVMTAVFTDRKVGWSYECGFGMTNRSGVVTKSDGVDVYEIDNRPALEVYNEWTDGKAYDVVREPKAAHGGWLVFTAQHPLGKPVNSPHGQVGQLVIKVALNKASLDKKDLPCAAPVEQGSRIWLLSGSWQALLNRAEYGPRKAMEQGGIASGEQAFGVGFFCQGAQPMLPPEELPKFSLLLNEGTGGAPFIGMLTLGEQGPIVPGWKNASANLVQSMVMVGQ